MGDEGGNARHERLASVVDEDVLLLAHATASHCRFRHGVLVDDEDAHGNERQTPGPGQTRLASTATRP